LKQKVNYKGSKRLAAFTIMELIIVMLLSTLIFGMALTAFQIMQRLYRQYDELSTETTTLDRFRALLAYDVEQATSLHYTENQLILKSTARTLHYQFQKEAIVRKDATPSSLADTLWTAASKIECTWQKGPVQEGPIDQIALTLFLFEKPLVLQFCKSLDAAYYINKAYEY